MSVIIRPVLSYVADPEAAAHYLPSEPGRLLRADPVRRTAVRFRSGNLQLAGHLYRPRGVTASTRTPGVVLAGPISSVKEQTVPHYAQRLADAGYTALTFDSRSFGESEGEPRSHYDPSEVIADYQSAVSYLMTREDVDATRVGAVGICMGGGYAVSLGARDKRLKAVVAVAGGYDIGRTFQKFLGVDGFAEYLTRVNRLVFEHYRTGKVQYMPTIAKALTEDVPVAAMPNPEAYSYYDRTSREDAPNWSPRMTVASLEPYFIYNSIVHAPLVAPTPLQIIHGTRDTALLPEFAQQVYDAAVGPKELVWIETHNHIELYDQDPYVSEACGHAIRWLDTFLKREGKSS